MKYLRGIVVVGLALAANPVVTGHAEVLQTGKPIEITANSLEVLQKEQQAIFRGDVRALQGNIRLRADEMQVHYRNDSAKENQISKIDVRGNVFLATPGETAQGQTGTYDVDKAMLYLNGNVMLTRDENVIRGQKLTYNLNTGRSKIDSGAGAAPSEAGTKQPEGGRVRGVFFPGSEK